VSGLDIPESTLKTLHAIRPPKDYFGQTCSSDNLWPHHILCFTRKSQQETAAEPLARNHHHRHVLVIPCQGGGKVFIDDRQFSVNYPEVLLIFPFQYHHGYSFDRAHVLWLYITFEIENGDALDSLRLKPVRLLEKEDFLIVWKLVDAWTSKTRLGELAYWLGLLLARLVRAPGRNLAGEKPNKRINRSSSLLVRINHFCMANLHQAIGLGELSSRLGISQSHMRARFRAETGISLGQHLRRLRLQKAMGLLVQSELSITQIADRCGFESIFAFSRSFRRFSGMMAKEYRRRFTRV
jgi:AraC-like DNA-binding protein